MIPACGLASGGLSILTTRTGPLGLPIRPDRTDRWTGGVVVLDGEGLPAAGDDGKDVEGVETGVPPLPLLQAARRAAAVAPARRAAPRRARGRPRPRRPKWCMWSIVSD